MRGDGVVTEFHNSYRRQLGISDRMEAQLQRIVLQQSHNFVLREMRISSQTLQGRHINIPMKHNNGLISTLITTAVGTAVSNTATPRRKSTALAIKAENSKAKVLLHQRHPCGNATKAYPVVLLELGN